jgi:hypothetical protein
MLITHTDTVAWVIIKHPNRWVLQLRSKRQLAAKDMMVDPKGAIRKIRALPAMIQVLSEIVQVGVV